MPNPVIDQLFWPMFINELLMIRSMEDQLNENQIGKCLSMAGEELKNYFVAGRLQVLNIVAPLAGSPPD